MSGLDMKEIQLSAILNDQLCEFRLESEYYSKQYDKMIQLYKKQKTTELSELVSQKIVTGHTPSMKNDNYYGGNIKFIKTDNLRDNFIKLPFTHYLSEEGNKLLSRSSLRKNDLIMTIIGATHKIVGRSCMIDENILPANINQNIALIRANKLKVSPYYLNVFLHTRYGKDFLRRLSRQTEQVNLNCEEVGKISIVRFSPKFENIIVENLKKSYLLTEQSERKYKDSEDYLIKNLKLDQHDICSNNIAVKNFSNSFLKNGRLDAEYYQPKYDEFEKMMKKMNEATLNLYNRNYIPKDNNIYKYIELSNVRRDGIIEGVDKYKGKDLPTRARRKVKKGQVLVSSIEGSLSSCALVTEEFDGSICTNGFYVVDSDEVNSETLVVLKKSWFMQEILKRECSGTILSSINKEDFLKIKIPLVCEKVQNRIKDNITEMYELRNRVEILINRSIKAVEIAIECGEKTAIEFLKEEKV